MSDKVLVYRVGSLGDTVVSLPALRLVARAFPTAERWLLTNVASDVKATMMSQVLEGTALVTGFIQYELGLRDPVRLACLMSRIRKLRAHTLVYLAAPRGRARAWRDALFFRACGIRRLIGLPYTKDLQHARQLGDGLYEYEGARLVRCLSELGDARLDDPSAFDLVLSESEFTVARTWLAHLADGRPIVAASIGAKVDVKDWGDSNWSALLRALSHKMPGWGMVMLGSADERIRSDQLLKNWRGDAVNVCGVLNVRTSAALLASCRLLIGHDSGPMHLAAAVGTPCVAIFSSRNLPGEWFPYGKNHRVLYQQMPCQGCRLEFCKRYEKACISSITVDTVEAAVLEVGRRKVGA